MKKILLLLLLISTNGYCAATFDKVDDDISVGTSNNLMTNGSAQTISAWVYAISDGEGNDARIMGRLSTTGEIFGITGGDHHLIFYSTWSGNDTFAQGSANSVPLSTWVNVIATWDGGLDANNIHLYVNNVDTRSSINNGTGAADSNAGQTTYIGNDAGNANTFDGNIVEVAYYNRVLTSAERDILYNNGRVCAGAPLKISGLQGYWPISEQASGAIPSGANVRDDSGLGNIGTPHNGTTYSLNPVNIVPCDSMLQVFE